MANEFFWVYIVIFLAIPLLRIMPRIIRKIRAGGFEISGYEKTSDSSYAQKDRELPRHQTSDMLVLGQIIAGAKTFESIQKFTKLTDTKLDSILQDLERDGLMQVKQRQGPFGSKIELLPTQKGLRAFRN